MSNMVQRNMKQAQAQQKRWYDRTARQCVLQEGEKVLVLLPTSTSKLLAQWQGPYIHDREEGWESELHGRHGGQKNMTTYLPCQHASQVERANEARTILQRGCGRGRIGGTNLGWWL